MLRRSTQLRVHALRQLSGGADAALAAAEKAEASTSAPSLCAAASQWQAQPPTCIGLRPYHGLTLSKTRVLDDALGSSSLCVKHLSTQAKGVTGTAGAQEAAGPGQLDVPQPEQGEPQQPLQQQQQQQEKQREASSKGWEDDEAEGPPIPLDPNVEPPGMLFVTGSAVLSALLAVGVAGLGILGTFYAGYAISQAAKEARATSGGGKEAADRPAAASKAPDAGAAATTAPSQAKAETQPKEAASSSGASRAEAAPVPAAQEAAVPAAGGSGSGAAGAPQRRSWWAWLKSRLPRRRQQTQQQGEPEGALTPAGSG